jgi:hypothetical protein
MRWTAAWPAAFAALALLATGCGGSSNDTTTAPPISKAEFIKKADSVCAKAGKETATEYASFAKEENIGKGKEPTPAQFAALTETILAPALRRQVDEIRALGAPSRDGALIDRFLSAVGDAIVKAEEKPTKAAESPAKLLADADKLIGSYGFKVCGQQG